MLNLVSQSPNLEEITVMWQKYLVVWWGEWRAQPVGLQTITSCFIFDEHVSEISNKKNDECWNNVLLDQTRQVILRYSFYINKKILFSDLDLHSRATFAELYIPCFPVVLSVFKQKLSFHVTSVFDAGLWCLNIYSPWKCYIHHAIKSIKILFRWLYI